MADETVAMAVTDKDQFIVDMARELGTDSKMLWNVVRESCFKLDKDGKGASDSEVMVYLMTCGKLSLNPLMREAYGFLSRGALQVGVGIDGWLKIANRHPQFDGIELEEIEDENGQLVACRATVWRKDRKAPTILTEWLKECQRSTDPWKQRPRRMLRHKATIQSLRYAFAITGISDMEEALEAARNINGEHGVSMLPPAENRTSAIVKALEATEQPEQQPSEEPPGHLPEPMQNDNEPDTELTDIPAADELPP